MTIENKNILNEAQRVFDIECEGLFALKKALEGSFGEAYEKAIQTILTCQGRVIVTGMGKSGHVARKIAATFASTGTPAQFIHPAEASHGDLGMIAQEDLIMALSNSGETKELSDMIVYSRRNKLSLIGVTQRESSTLAKEADIALVMPKVDEACPNRLAPTTSSLMMLALGDALAMTLLKLKGFSPKDFHTFHPGGQLGKQLCRVGDLMYTGDTLPLVALDTPMQEAITRMTKGRLGCIGVTDSKKKLVGVITDGDLRRHLGDNILHLTVQDVMTPNPKFIQKETLAAEGLRLMNHYQITCLFVTDKQQHPIGAFHMHEALRAGLD